MSGDIWGSRIVSVDSVLSGTVEDAINRDAILTEQEDALVIGVENAIRAEHDMEMLFGELEAVNITPEKGRDQIVDKADHDFDIME